jgi:predicted acyltransferase
MPKPWKNLLGAEHQRSHVHRHGVLGPIGVFWQPKNANTRTMKKNIGRILWLIALVIPFQSALLNTEGVGNMTGLFSFLAMIVLVFAGYALVDSGKAQVGTEHGGH